MESDTFQVDFVWLPSEEELPGVASFLELKGNKNFAKSKQLASVKSFLSKLFDVRVQILDFKQKFVLADSNGSNSLNIDKVPLYMFYTVYLYQISCKVMYDRKLKFSDNYIEECKRLIKTFCSQKGHLNFPKLWLNIDISRFVEEDLSTKNDFIDMKKFSLGNLVGLNEFVEHFNSETSLSRLNYKITQVKVKFLHDELMMHVYFVVGNSKVSLKKRGPHTHRMHRLLIPYSSLHTILICCDESFTAYFRLYKSPMLYAVEQNEEAESYVSYLDLRPNTFWHRTVNLFDGCPPSIRKEFSLNSVLQLNFCSENYEILKIMLHHKSVQIYFSPMSVIPYKQVPLSFQFNTFDCYYGFHCLLTHSYEICDHLMMKDEMNTFKKFITDKCTENPEAVSETFYVIFSAINQCNIIIFNHAVKNLYERLSKIEMDNENKNSNLLKVKKAIIVPTHVRLIPPQFILKSRALRDCDPNYSLRLNIRDINLECLNFTFKGSGEKKKVLLEKFFDTYFKKPMLDGIKIDKRRYEYVGSSTSQLRSHGLWFYAKDESNKTAETLRKTFGDMTDIKLVPKFMARMGQTFSQSQGNIIVPQVYTNIDNPEEDVKGGQKAYLIDDDSDKRNPSKFLKRVSESEIPKILECVTISESSAPDGIIKDDPYIFSDGIGRISQEIAEQVYKKLGLEKSRPSAMQIRYAGCKGMLVVDPNLVGKKILFRKSMKKFSSKSDSLEILKYSEKRTASLNRPLITILEQLGVPKNVFIQLQKEMIQSHIRSMFHENDACNFLNRNSQIRFNFIGMHKAGFRFTEDPLFRSMIYGLFRKQLGMLRTKANIEIPPNKGRSMFGVLDETFTLEYGQVFIQYTDWCTEEPKIFEGPVVVTKNPCMHPGDVRKFEAVDVKDLHHIRDCIVFPAKGKRPHPDEMAGSDLDGDEYEVLFLKDFLFPRENYEAMDYAVPKNDTGKTQENTSIQPANELDHVCNYIINDNVGLIANAHLVYADKENDGIFGENCLRLAKKYALALDFAKTGVSVSKNKKDRVFTYPDFMEKLAEKPTYVSKKALGILYRHCKKLEMGLEISSTGTEFREDPDLAYENWQEYQRKALKMYKNYCKKVENLINMYSFNDEGELLAGAIINPPKYYEQRHDLENLKALLEYEIQWIFSNLEKQFFDEFGGKPTDRNYTSKMYQKASAWYIVTYRDIPGKAYQYFGFPWAVSDVLMKLKSNRCLHRGYPVANVKSLLEETVDESLKKYMPTLSDETHAIHENRLKIIDVAYDVLTQWLKTLGELLQSDLKKFELLLYEAFEFVSNRLATCEKQYIDHLKETNNLKQAISPCYLIIETLLRIANIKVTDAKVSFTDTHYELGLLSWVTLIKLACSYNPQYLGIANKDGNYANSAFYIPQDNVISTFRLPLFKRDANEEFSLKLLHKSEEVISYLQDVTKLKKIDFRYDMEGVNEYVAVFTVRGTRYAIEKLKDLMVLSDFYDWVVKGKKI